MKADRFSLLQVQTFLPTQSSLTSEQTSGRRELLTSSVGLSGIVSFQRLRFT